MIITIPEGYTPHNTYCRVKEHARVLNTTSFRTFQTETAANDR